MEKIMAQPILLVEDDPDAQALVSHVLSHLNIPYQIVDNAELAIEHLNNNNEHYHAVITDLALPGKDGWELLATIRQNPATVDLICVAITAFHTSKMKSEALKSGFDAYFAKPIDVFAFADELSAIL